MNHFQIQESHSEEVARAVWKMHQKGLDVKTIMERFESCELDVSKKYIQVTIKNSGFLSFSPSTNGAAATEELVEEQAVIEEEMGETHQNETISDLEDQSFDQRESVVISLSDHSTSLTENAQTQSQSADYNSYACKRPRRMKTTEELIKQIEEDFRRFPDAKVKDRAAKFGIAVGTLCQIKHNVLKMPKENGRTWKSTPQMVEAIRADIEADPTMKVKDRAEKFNISVGTLCRIMHDMLQRPKRTTGKAGEFSRIDDGMESYFVLAEAPSISRPKPPRKRVRRVQEQPQQYLELLSTNFGGGTSPSMLNLNSFAGATQESKQAKDQKLQVQLKGSGTSQVLVLTFDNANTGAGPGQDEEVVWVVNSEPTVSVSQLSAAPSTSK